MAGLAGSSFHNDLFAKRPLNSSYQVLQDPWKVITAVDSGQDFGNDVVEVGKILSHAMVTEKGDRRDGLYGETYFFDLGYVFAFGIGSGNMKWS